MRLHYTIHGDSGNPALIMLHGFLGSGRDWENIAPALTNNFRCVAVDLPGHGKSRIEPGEACGMVETATAILELADELDCASFSLLGYSMGGRIALYMEQFYSMRIDRVVAESASLGLRTKLERDERRAQDEALAQESESGSCEDFLRRWYDQPLFSTLHRDPAALEGLIRRRLDNDQHQLAHALRGLGTGAQPSLWDDWPAVNVPTLLIAGALDTKYAALARDMADTCPFATCAVVPDCGHNVHEENPAEYTARVVQFLREG